LVTALNILGENENLGKDRDNFAEICDKIAWMTKIRCTGEVLDNSQKAIEALEKAHPAHKGTLHQLKETALLSHPGGLTKGIHLLHDLSITIKRFLDDFSVKHGLTLETFRLTSATPGCYYTLPKCIRVNLNDMSDDIRLIYRDAIHHNKESNHFSTAILASERQPIWRLNYLIMHDAKGTPSEKYPNFACHDTDKNKANRIKYLKHDMEFIRRVRFPLQEVEKTLKDMTPDSKARPIYRPLLNEPDLIGFTAFVPKSTEQLWRSSPYRVYPLFIPDRENAEYRNHCSADLLRTATQLTPTLMALKSKSIINLGGTLSSLNSRFNLKSPAWGLGKGEKTTFYNFETAGNHSKKKDSTIKPNLIYESTYLNETYYF